VTTVMWEVKAAAGRGERLLAFVLERADPLADVYRSADERIVVIDPTGRGIADVPPELIARTPHVWPFERVAR
jgi:hypothetical protein